MPRPEQRRQQAKQKQSGKRKEKQKRARALSTGAGGSRAELRMATSWPLHECLISSGWRDPKNLTQVIVARRAPAGDVAAAVFLVDLGCLGVKDAFWRTFASRFEYEAELVEPIAGQQPLAPVSLDLAAKVMREAIAYARPLGFNPPRDFADASQLLTGANPDAAIEEIPLGVGGKPFYVAGPYDNPQRIVHQLERTAGPGNYDYVVFAGPDGRPPKGIDPAHVELAADDEVERVEQIATARLQLLPPELIEALPSMSDDEAADVLAPFWPIVVFQDFLRAAPEELRVQVIGLPIADGMVRLSALMPPEMREHFQQHVEAGPESYDDYLYLPAGPVSDMPLDLPDELLDQLENVPEGEADAVVDGFMLGQLLQSVGPDLPPGTAEELARLPVPEALARLLAIAPDDLRERIEPFLTELIAMKQREGGAG